MINSPCQHEMNIEELQATFISLRECWNVQWPGLPAVMTTCLLRLGHQSPFLMAPNTQSIHDCIQVVAQLIEQDGQVRASLNQEPAYHNRLHVANTLVALTTLLLLQRQFCGDSRSVPSHTEWMAMLTMVSHDLLHDGSVNIQKSQIEARSAQHLEPLMNEFGVTQSDQHIIKTIILSTDPTLVKACHEIIKNRPFCIEDVDCLTVLIQEADIMASTMPDVGPLLTKQLACEWSKTNCPGVHALNTLSGRIEFLRNGALFSSPASQLLGVDAVKAAQLLELGANV